MKFVSSDNFKHLVCITIFLMVSAVVIPALNAFVPPESFFHVSDFNLTTWGKYLCFAVVAISLNLLWGYTGLLCLGQALFFGLGGYAFGMYLMLKIGKLGQYKSDLPDFMVFQGYAALPAHWEPFYSFWFSVAMVGIVPGLLALVFGFLVFRSRIKGVYFSIITQALTYAAFLLFNRNEATFGGTNGFTDFKFILDFAISDMSTKRALFVISALYLVGCIGFVWWLKNTKFGKIQEAIRDSENRVRFSGYNTTEFKLFVFVASAIMAGFAGALYVPQAGIINPGEMIPSKSLEIVVWVAVGGRATLWGPVIGAILVNWLKSYATVEFPDQWLIMLGGLFVFVVLFMPNGVVGLPAQIRGLIQKYQKKPAETPGAGGGDKPASVPSN